MELEIRNRYNVRPTFSGILDTTITKSLDMLNTNPMLNASLVDVSSMGIPRTVIEYKKRNKYAGAEMAFREFTGTFIACFSAGLFAQLINKTVSKFINPEVKINGNSWASNNMIDVLNSVWNNSDKTSKGYSEEFFNSLSGLKGDKNVNWKSENISKINWYDKNAWKNFRWDDKNYEQIYLKIKSKKTILTYFEKLISDKNISKNDYNNLLKILTYRTINILGVESSLELKNSDKSVNSTIQNILRDSADLGRNVFMRGNIEASIKKLKKLNSVKTLGAISLSAILALTNQFLNRHITKKRTGSSEFVGDIGYGDKKNGIKDKKNDKKFLTFNKILASGAFIAMLGKVMNVKTLKDFVKKLEFTGPTTGGNAIKTVYGALILGRLLASNNNTELRETVVRDYFGFLNWLVLGGFASKGIANLLDRNRKFLFNTQAEGSGIKHWLNDVNLKTHFEVMAQGGKNVKYNIWKLNIAHLSGLLYSGLMLGVVLTKINIAMTKRKKSGNLNIEKYSDFALKKDIPPVFEGLRKS